MRSFDCALLTRHGRSEERSQVSIEAVRRDLEFDLFVSYAHVDDGDGWVSALVEAIKRELAGFTPAPPRVFFDRQAIRDMHDWEMRIL